LEIAILPRPGRFNEIATKVMEKGEKFVDMVKQNATEKKVSVKTDVIIGTPSVVKEIVEYAENNKVDMIVIGSRGMTGFKKLLLGNVSSGVVTYSHCPANFTFLRGRSKIISSANDVLNKYFDYLFMYHRLKTRIGTLPINWNSNRNHDCSWYILYDKETG
jgi:dihydrodipicolinate reductase